MMAGLHIETNLALELPGALMNYASRTDAEEDRIKSSEKIIEWQTRVEGQISPFLSSDTEQLFQFHTVYTFLMFVVLREELESPEELLEWLDAGKIEKAREYLMEIFQLDGLMAEDVGLDTLIQSFEEQGELYRVPVEEEAQLALYALEKSEMFLQRLRLVLGEFYRLFVEPEIQMVKSFLDTKRAEHQDLLEKDAEKFLNQITLDNFSSLYKESEGVRLILTFFANRFISLNTQRLNVIVYGFDAEQLLADADVSKDVDEYLKALSDPKRAEIVRLLKRRQWYGKELAEHFSVSTATMSYHLEKLLSSRLIRFETAERHKILYSMNRKGMEAMIEALQKDFL